MTNQEEKKTEEQNLSKANLPANDSQKNETNQNSISMDIGTKFLIKELKEINEKYLNNWKRALADLENFKKETEKQKTTWIQFSNLNLVLSLLPILDNLEKAFKEQPSTENQQIVSWVNGIKNIKKQFEDLFKKMGIEEIKSIDEKFNPEFHEAISQEKVENKESGIVLKELRKGYRMHGQVIRPVGVVVNQV